MTHCFEEGSQLSNKIHTSIDFGNHVCLCTIVNGTVAEVRHRTKYVAHAELCVRVC